MRAILILLVTVLILSIAPARAADYSSKPLGNAPPTVTLQFSVPYSFSNVHQDLQHAVISCVAAFAPKTPPIGRGETTVLLNGQPKSGTATVVVNPLPGQKLSDAKFYSCGMQVSNGKMTMMPQSSGGGPKWGKVQLGSTVMVSGQIP